MDLTGSNPSSARRTKAQMLELLNLFDTSHGMTVTAFCKLHQISKASFYSARSRYGRTDVAKKKPSGFIAITQGGFKEPGGILFAKANGIELYQWVPADYLKALVL